MKRLKWGILAPGIISHKFAKALHINGSELYAVGSRTLSRAETFAAEYGAPRVYGSYEELLADEEVDVVYIANPHSHHAKTIIRSLRAGKHVLCEKPLCVSRAEAEECRRAAQENGRFLMEAMWSRFLPMYHSTLPDLLREGIIGEIRMITADYSFDGDPDPDYRILNAKLAGGGLLDVGVYAVHFTNLLLGNPTEIASVCHVGETGVDLQSAISMKFGHLAVANITTGIKCVGTQEAVIVGTKGFIRLPYFSQGQTATIHVTGAEPEELDCRYENGFQYEIAETERCIAEGLLESPVLPLSTTMDVLRTMDTLRNQWGTDAIYREATRGGDSAIS